MDFYAECTAVSIDMLQFPLPRCQCPMSPWGYSTRMGGGGEFEQKFYEFKVSWFLSQVSAEMWMPLFFQFPFQCLIVYYKSILRNIEHLYLEFT